jgi:cardiolipin synthase A/B
VLCAKNFVESTEVPGFDRPVRRPLPKGFASYSCYIYMPNERRKKNIFTTSLSAWHAMAESVRDAKTSIYLEMYIFEDENMQPGLDFVSLLAQKAQEGVRVVVIPDAFGSRELSNDATERLRSAGVEVLFYTFYLKRTHRKLLIVDENVAYVGGVNLSHRFSEWDDLVIRVRGRFVDSVVRSFARVYKSCEGTDASVLQHAKESPLKKARMWFVEHGVGTRHQEMRRQYIKHIVKAQKTIVLVTPYFQPQRWLLNILVLAMYRGVTVEVLLPLRGDNAIMDRLNGYYADRCTSLGMSIYWYARMNHSKAMLIDNMFGVIGSQNLDTLSFDWNVESSMFFDDPQLVADLRSACEAWKEQSVPHTMGTNRVWYDRPLMIFMRIIEPVL